MTTPRLISHLNCKCFLFKLFDLQGHLCHELCLASELGFTDADDNPDLGAVEAFFADSAAGEIFQSKGVVGQCDNDAEDTAAEGFLESLMARIGEGIV